MIRFRGYSTSTTVRWLCAIAAVAALATVTATARNVPVHTSWTVPDGDWANPANWDNGLPDISDLASTTTIANGGVATITTLGNQVRLLTIANGSGLRVAGGALEVFGIDLANNSEGFLEITSGGKVVQGSGSLLLTAFSPGGEAAITVDGSGSLLDWDDGPDLNLGTRGTATITLIDGGELRATTVNLGQFGGSGTITIGGPGIAPGLLNADVEGIDTASLVVYATQNLDLDSDISGTVKLTKEADGTLTLTGTNTYNGGTTINAGTLKGAVVNLPGNIETNGTLMFAEPGTATFGGDISGSGGVSVDQTGTVTLTGTLSYTGPTTVIAGTLRAGKNDVLPAASALVLAGGTFDLNGFNQTVASLSGTSAVQIGNGTLTVGDAGTDTTYSGVLSGGTLTKAGNGALTLTGANTHTFTQLQAGSLFINGTQPTSGVFVQDGTFGGTGSIGELLSTGGTIAPGLSPGLLTVASVTSSSITTFEVEIDGPAAGTDYDQLRVTSGIVDLSDATLNVDLGFTPDPGAVFTIIDKQSAGPVTGTFNGLAEGAVATFGGTAFTISYAGGDGNDVTLTAPAAVPSMPTGVMALLAAMLGLIGWMGTRAR